MPFSDTTPLGVVRTWLHKARDTGARCPACDQIAKVYRRRLNAGMAASLIAMYQAGGTDFVHIPTAVGSRSREEGKLRYWRLVEEQLTVRPDGGRAGYWRVTRLGKLFVLGRVSVPEYALVYDSKCLGLEGRQVRIQDCLGNRFDYRELMSA